MKRRFTVYGKKILIRCNRFSYALLTGKKLILCLQILKEIIVEFFSGILKPVFQIRKSLIDVGKISGRFIIPIYRGRNSNAAAVRLDLC